MDVLLREGPTLSKDLKRLAGFGSGGLKGFDTVMTKDYLKCPHRSNEVRKWACLP